MFRKDNMLNGILGLKCPYCKEGEFFVSHPYDLRRIGDVHDYCPKCGGRFNREPGFYLGVMLVANAIGLAMGTAIWAAFVLLLPQVSVHWVVGTAMVLMLLAWPWVYAVSKILWAHMFLDFNNPTGLRRKGGEEGRP